MNWAARRVPGPARAPALADCTVPAQPSWAHVSGWNQLSGSLRHVSCVLMAGGAPESLARTVPRLSDTLTECGYPWEMITLFSAGDRAMARVANGWSRLPGFWSVAIPPGRLGESLGIALAAARGDAVMLAGDLEHMPLQQLGSAIGRWEAGCPLVISAPGADGLQALGWPELVHRLRAQGLPPDMARGGFHFALLDRQLVELLLL